MATIYDIAKKIGMSPTTVSKALNNYSDVSAKTKEKVLLAAKELGYVPNLTARSLKTNKSYLVGVMFSENVGIGLEHQYFSVVLENFRKKMGVYGYDTVFINKTVGEREIGYLEHCKYRNVDGVFIITATGEEVDAKSFEECNIKCITTDMHYDGVPVVISENATGASMAVEYLVEKGHKKIGHITGPLDTIAGYERYEGFLETAKKFDVYAEKYVCESRKFTYHSGYHAMDDLLKKCYGDYPTAVLVSADLMAIGVVEAIKDRGLKVPDDISVVGFDDIEMVRYITPKLTTVKQNKELLGEKVADNLYKLINGETLALDVVRIPVELVERDSVKTLD